MQEIGAHVETTVDVAASLDLVWEALVTDGGLEPWMGSGATIDPRPGGRLTLPDIVGGRPRAGRVETVEDCQELGFTWWPMTRPAERSRVSITVAPIETGTRVTVRETPPRRTATLSAAVALPTAGPTGLSTTPAPTGPTFRSGVLPTPLPTSLPTVSDGGAKPGARRLLIGDSLRGCWAWRLAMLTMSCQVARV